MVDVSGPEWLRRRKKVVRVTVLLFSFPFLASLACLDAIVARERCCGCALLSRRRKRTRELAWRDASDRRERRLREVGYTVRVVEAFERRSEDAREVVVIGIQRVQVCLEFLAREKSTRPLPNFINLTNSTS